MRVGVVCGALAAVVLAGGAVADPVVLFQSGLGDHPDGAALPPAYGLRLDGLFVGKGGGGGVTTFSFEENGAGVVLKILDMDMNGTADRISIAGKVYGGEDSGGGYGFGAGLYSLDFTMSVGVQTESNGWSADSIVTNGGSLTALGSYGGLVVDGTAFGIFLKNGAPDFSFLDDGWRLPGNSGYVGRGWLGGGGSSDTRDFLFITIPLPGGAGLALAGLGLVAIRRRRGV